MIERGCPLPAVAARAWNRMSIDPVLASTSVRTRSMSIGAPAFAGSDTAPEVYRPSGAASGGDASDVNAALAFESRRDPSSNRRAMSFDFVHARRARRLLRRRAGGAAVAELASECPRSYRSRRSFARRRIERFKRRVREGHSGARARMRYARPSGIASAAPDARVASRWCSCVDARTTRERNSEPSASFTSLAAPAGAASLRR
jgi:hypothetical protein